MVNDSIERECWANGNLLCGVDEAGYGNLFGSLYIAGVVFPANFDFGLLPGLKDSKLLKDPKRFELEKLVLKYAAWSFCEEISPSIIDKETGFHAKYRVAGEMINSDSNPFTNVVVIMDGNTKIKNARKCADNRCMVKGDMFCKSISAASILAKCAQRRQIKSLEPEYGIYDIAINSGYWSEKHVEALENLGPTKYHRLSYLKNIKLGPK